jgi:hypothetical protein
MPQGKLADNRCYVSSPAWASELPCLPLPYWIQHHAMRMQCWTVTVQPIAGSPHIEPVCTVQTRQPIKQSIASQLSSIRNTEQLHVHAIPCGLHCRYPRRLVQLNAPSAAAAAVTLSKSTPMHHQTAKCGVCLTLHSHRQHIMCIMTQICSQRASSSQHTTTACVCCAVSS